MAELLSSRKNRKIKQLLDAKRGKGSWADHCLPEGVRLCAEAVRAGLEVEAVFFTSAFTEAEVRAYGTEHTEYYLVEPALFRELADTRSPQGLLLVCTPPTVGDLSALTAQFQARPRLNLLVLESLQDPGNTGTIIRTAHALGYDAVVLCGSVANPYRSKVLRASMGSVFHLPLYKENESSKMLQWCKDEKVSVLAAALDGQSVKDYMPDPRLSLWIGNEGNGLSPEVLDLATAKLTIPMPGGAESLNAATAAGILLYRLKEVDF